MECPSFSAKALDHILETVMFVIVFDALPLSVFYTDCRLFFIRAFEPCGCKGGSLLSSFEFTKFLAPVRVATPEV